MMSEHIYACNLQLRDQSVVTTNLFPLMFPESTAVACLHRFSIISYFDSLFFSPLAVRDTVLNNNLPPIPQSTHCSSTGLE